MYDEVERVLALPVLWEIKLADFSMALDRSLLLLMIDLLSFCGLIIFLIHPY